MTEQGETTRHGGHAFVDGVVDELIRARTDSRTAAEDLTHRINGVSERLSGRMGEVEQRVEAVERAVAEMRNENRAFATNVVELLTDIQRRLPPAVPPT